MTAWITDPVTVRVAAMLDDERLGRLAAWLTPDTGFDQRFAIGVPDDPAGADLREVEIIAWAHSRLICSVRFSRDVAGEGVRYADSALTIGGTPPETMRAGAVGAPMETLLPHPLFRGLRWSEDQGSDALLTGPACDIALGASPGARLASLARAARADMAATT